MRDGYRVIDVDSHVTPSMEVLQKLACDGIKSRINQRSWTLPYPESQHVQNDLTTYKGCYLSHLIGNLCENESSR